MYPGYHYHRRPSRIFWFLFGGLAATWFIKHKECQTEWQDRAGFCVRKRVLPHPAPSVDTAGDEKGAAESVSPQADGARSDYGAPYRWEEEKERLLALGKQAGDTMAEMSESTLDAVISTVEMLKAKLAEHRAQREAQRRKEYEALKKLA